jgi:hypothetical protein
MNRTALVTSEKKTESPILIVDKEGDIGEALAKELKNESLVVFVSRRAPEVLDNIVHIPFLKKIPTIPDNRYSHIFLIDESLETTNELMQAFIKKAKNDDSFLNLIVGLNSVTKPLTENFINEYDKAKVIITGEIFKRNAIYNPHSNINKFILQVKTQGKILIPGDGTRTIAPVYFDDVVGGILETAFGVDEKDKIIYLFPKHKVTFLSLANMFRKKDPDLRIDFTKETGLKQNNFLPGTEGVYLLGETYNLEDRIKKIEFSSIPASGHDEKEEPGDKGYKEKENPIYNFKILFLSLIFFILLPTISTLLFSLMGVGSLYVVKDSIEKGHLSSARVLVPLASGSFAIAKESSLVLFEEAKIIGRGNNLSGLIGNINSGEEISNAILSLIDASDKLKAILTGKSTNSSFDFSSAVVELKNALYTYNKEEQRGIIPQGVVKKLNDTIKIASSTIDLWPDIFGFSGQRTYLILFQNNMELRPGGGFIGSYGILSVNKGRIVSLNIYDVYDADGQLKGHIEPPYPVRRYLPSAHWYLRDSNFNIDFSKGAITSAVFLNTEMRQTVDGVIGVDLSFVKKILSVTGPVKVADYNQTVNSDNFFEIAQAHAEKDFFPGSTQKKDFLRSFYNSLQIKISEQRDIPYLPLFLTLTESIYEKHVLFAFNNSNEQATFAINGWSSALIDQRQSNEEAINDFMGINEANFGADKVNYYVTRSLSQNVNIKSDGSIDEVLTITFKNTAKADSPMGGIYKNYLRTVFPLNASISKIQIDGKEQKIVPAVIDPTVYEKKDFVPPAGLEVQKENQGQNTIYGFSVTLQPQDLRTIKIEYALPQKIDLSQPKISYNLKLFKQPGVDFYPYNFSLDFPASFKVLDSSSDVETKGNNASLSTQITRDRELSINLAAK